MSPGDVRMRMRVMNSDVVDDIGDAIVRGVKRSADRKNMQSIGHDMRRKAEAKIRSENRVWSGELLDSFDVTSVETSSGAILTLTNDAEHARPVDEGATYGDEGPPLFALLPWVITEMGHVKVSDDGQTLVKK